MDFVVYDGDKNFIGIFNKFNIFFVDKQMKYGFLKIYYSKGFDSAIEWLKWSGYSVEVVE